MNFSMHMHVTRCRLQKLHLEAEDDIDMALENYVQDANAQMQRFDEAITTL